MNFFFFFKNRICAVKGIFKILFYCRFKGIIVANQSVSISFNLFLVIF